MKQFFAAAAFFVVLSALAAGIVRHYIRLRDSA